MTKHKDKENSIKISAVASVPLGRNGMGNLEFVKPGGDNFSMNLVPSSQFERDDTNPDR